MQSMYLASAGRLYSRKSSEEEFSRYVYDCGVVDTFRAGLICLFEMPIKPVNLEEYFAEFLENHAFDLIELAILRAELCYKNSEAQDLRIRHESLDTKILELEKKSGLTTEAFQWAFQNPTPDQDERKYETMRRFFKDIEEYHPSLLYRHGTAITKDEERLWGGEGEGRSHSKLNTETKSGAQNSLKKDSYDGFVADLKKFDPWGLIFPYIRRSRDPLMPPAGSDHDQDMPMYFTGKSQVENEPNILSSELPDYSTLLETLEDPTNPGDDAPDDAKSIAEMIMEEQLAAEEQLLDSNEAITGKKISEGGNQSMIEERASHAIIEQRSEVSETGGEPREVLEQEQHEAESQRRQTYQALCSSSFSGLHTWDTEYWKQFFQEGDIAPNFAIRVVDSHSSIYGAWNAPNKDIQLQYFNPQKFSDTDTDADIHGSDENQRLSTLKFESDVIKNSAANKQFAYAHIWTADKFTNQPLPLSAIDGVTSPLPYTADSFKQQSQHDLVAYNMDDDVINTDISFGDPALRCRLQGNAQLPDNGNQRESFPLGSAPRLPKLSSNVSINRPLPSRKSYPSDTSIEDHDPVKKLEPQWDKARGSRGAFDENIAAMSHRRSTKVTSIEEGAREALRVSMGAVRYQDAVSAFSEEQAQHSIPVDQLDGIDFQAPAESEIESLPTPSKCNRAGMRSDIFRKRLMEKVSMVRSQQRVHTVASNYPGNPCDVEQLQYFHPYPELLQQQSRTPPKSKEQRLLKFCKEHYDDATIAKFQQDFDFSFFDDLL